MAQNTEQPVLFPGFEDKPVHVQFDQPAATSDGGAILLGMLDRAVGITESLAGCISDDRQSSKVEHSLRDLVRQRVFSIACGYADCNDAARLRGDAVQKLLVGRDPVDGNDLASQATLSRFENAITAGECYRIVESMAELTLGRHRKRLGSRKVRRITLDFDGSADPTHGHQQLSLFNGFYDTWCYFPLFGFVRFNDEVEQYLLCSLLRGGCAKEVEGSLGVLKRLVPRLRQMFPAARIRVRLDAGFNGPELFNLLDRLKVEYAVGIAGNSVLAADSASLVERTRRQSESHGETVQLFGETQYSAGSWKNAERRVVFKAERLQSPWHLAKDNVRYVVTNFQWTPKNVYGWYCDRGDVENRIKELKEGVEVDRTSCHRALANQFRILLHSAAFMLYQELRLRARRTSLARAQVSSLQIALIKIGGIVKRSVRRITIHLSENHPWIEEWGRVARACGAALPITN